MSRTLRCEALAAEVYRVTTEPQFSSGRQDTTTLSHVNRWVEDSNSSTSVSSARGSFAYPPGGLCPELYFEFDYHLGHQIPAGFDPVHHLKESSLLHASRPRSQRSFCVQTSEIACLAPNYIP